MITNYPEYPKEQIEWLKAYYPTHSFKDTYKAFNEHFGTNLSEASVKHRISKFKIHTIYDGKFKKSGKAWNKGMDLSADRPDIYEQYISGKRFRFVKGQKPANTLPIGTITKHRDFNLIKTGDTEWTIHARYVYEQTHNCKLDKDDKILHLDGNKYNDEPNNLIKVNSKILARLNKQGFITSDADLTKVAVIREKLIIAIKELEDESS